MKKIVLLLLFIPIISFSQSKKFKKDYKKALKSSSFLFMTDWRESNYSSMLYNENKLSKIISNSAEYGYKIVRYDGEFIFKDGLYYFVVLEKDINDFNYEFFPGYSIGTVYKKFYFTGNTIEEAIIGKVETEINLLEYSNVSAARIMNYFEFVKNFVKRSFLERYNLESSSNKYNIKSMWGKYYDIVEINKIWRINEPINDYKVERNLSIGNGTEKRKNRDGNFSDFYKIVFSIEDPMVSSSKQMLETYSQQSEKGNNAINELQFNVEGADIRKINQYDLEAMVKVFLKDCKKNNLSVPKIETLDVKFAPLEGSTLALAYGYNDDSIIKIVVDDVEWTKASIEKRWYVLYHELGHDVLNLEHGQGGKMMFSLAEKEYSWDDFFKDKEYMFNFKK